MKTPLLALFALIASSLTSAVAAPDAGRYAGLVTITKTVFDLSYTYTLRAEASVAPNGNIRILTAVPESPSAAINADSSVTEAKPYVRPPGEIVTITIPGDFNPGPTIGFPPENFDPFAGHNYVIDDTIPADLLVTGQRFSIIYTTPTIAPPAVPLKRTHIKFQFLKKR